MKKFKMVVECERPDIPAARMSVCAGVSVALSKASGGDRINAIMDLLWAAVHVAREGGAEMGRIEDLIVEAAKHAVACEVEFEAGQTARVQ